MVAPLMLKLLVEWLGRPANDDPDTIPRPLWEAVLLPSGAYFGWTAAAALGLSCVAKAALNSHFHWGMVSQGCYVKDGEQRRIMSGG